MLFSWPAFADNGLIHVKSHFDVASTAERLETILAKKHMTVFLRINHAKAAAGIGQSLRPTELLIFGNPKAGTALMRCAQSVAIDLPQKALIWKDMKGQVWLSYNDPAYLAKRHHIKGCDRPLKKISNALEKITQAATSRN